MFQADNDWPRTPCKRESSRLFPKAVNSRKFPGSVDTRPGKPCQWFPLLCRAHATAPSEVATTGFPMAGEEGSNGCGDWTLKLQVRAVFGAHGVHLVLALAFGRPLLVLSSFRVL